MIKYLFLICLSLPIFAAPFSAKTYKFQKEVKLKTSNESTDGIATAVKLQLDEEIFLGSFYGDLRLLADGNPVPYDRKFVKIKNRGEEQVDIKQLIKKRETEETIFVLELPNLPKDHVYTAIYASQEGADEANIQVSAGPSPDAMSFVTDAFVYSYGDKPQNKIAIGPTKHRFVRISAPPGSNLRFELATREKIQSNAYFSKEIEKVDGEKKEDQIVYLIENQSRSPFTSLKLYFKETKFERDIKIEHFKNNREWETVFESKVFHTDSEDPDLFISLGQMISNTYRITVINGENPPLHLNKITQLQAKEELVFYLPTESFSQLKLYYGNRYAKTPDFDPSLIPTENDEISSSLTLGSGEENPDFGFSIVEPPFSGYVANAIFYLGIIVLIGIGFRFYRASIKQ
jgi:hypothetical protein